MHGCAVLDPPRPTTIYDSIIFDPHVGALRNLRVGGLNLWSDGKTGVRPRLGASAASCRPGDPPPWNEEPLPCVDEIPSEHGCLHLSLSTPHRGSGAAREA
eukprot:scaffold230252_cov35-Tisochrysis_lutea.AAC.1